MTLILIVASAVCVAASIPLVFAGELVLGGVALALGLVILAAAITIEISFERVDRPSRPWVF